ncbi:MAG: hypothetical protein KDE27_29760, partial [Planctomycetes bacterium]|nr:hypothetical protein [Planctomycetota bacterium]
YRLDPAGRASRLLERDTQWLLLVVDGSRVYAGEIDPNQTPERLELATREPPRLRVRVLDERGRPVAGAGLKASSFGCEGGTSPFETQLALLTSRLYIRSLERATTDAEGWLELPMFAEHLVQFEVYARKGEARSEDWPLRYGEQPFEVRLNSK